MLVLSRHKNERVMIGDNVILTIVEIRGGKVRLGFTADKSVAIHREEIYQRIRDAQDAGEGDAA